ncbi:hypothetical protein B0H16DRAFT_1736552 [Mycena metata]|uniref:Uncharacterized protein n=1 Tax=Mycena metata TaxID=1033252 RepID=A0AAD7MMT6_9AGAR|nr:hypothetical protein B0H16DRAFT_1736552 [Mycena metata]
MSQLTVEEADEKFKALADKVHLFNANVDVALDKAAEAKVKADLDNARMRLADLSRELEICKAKLNVGANEVFQSVAEGASHAAAALFSFGSRGSLTSVVGEIAQKYAMRKAECEHNMALINQEMHDILARDSSLGTIRTTLAESTKVAASVNAISSQIDMMVDIWKTINLDLHSLPQALSDQLKNNQRITKFSLAKLNVAQEIYGHLTYLLETYIEQVNELNTPEAKKSVAHIIRNIRTGFIIADTLIPHQDGDVLLLREEWTRLIKEFEKTLQFSFEQATDAVYMMKTVQTVLGDLTEADGKDLAVELCGFMKQLGPKEAGVLDMKTTFEKLAEDVLLFRASIDVALAKEHDKSKSALENARRRLAGVNNPLARDQDSGTMNLDMHSLEQALLHPLAGNPVITRFVLKKLGVAKEIYHNLTHLLETYVEQINAAGPASFN